MKSVLAIVTVALLSSAAFAQNAGRPPSISAAFDALDADKDSRISRTESQSSPIVAQSFAQADGNSDGMITREEFMSSFTMGGPESAPPGASREPPATSPNPPQ